MKKTYFLSVIVASLLFASESSNANIININKPIPHENNSSKIEAPNEAIIVFDESANPDDIKSKMKTALGDFNGTDYKLIKAMHIKTGKSFNMIKSLLEKIKGIKSIEPNYGLKPFNSSNDSYYSKLWAIENTGQEINSKSGTTDADMDVKEAWNIEKGDSSVVVAVVDTGVDYTHNDLADNMWRGIAKHGVDFAGDDNGNNDSDPMPDKPYDEKGHYHGTHVAGTIGAVGDNSLGVSGVAQNVQIMALKVFRPNGYGYSSDILEAMDYIAEQKDNGVNIVAVNASYGGGGSKGDSMDSAIAKLGEKGIVFCAAAGNDSKDIDSEPVYPASYTAKNIITVAASDQDDKLASFSNYGKDTVEVAAPGVNILSTYPDNQYAYLQGTSMATPNVSGVVALLASVKPSSSVEDRIKAVIENVDSKSSLSNKVSTKGRVNAYKALNALNSVKENTKPDANDDSATTEYETKVVIDVLSNDTDADSDSLTIQSLGIPSHGTSEIVDGKVEYTPESGYSGDDTFSYTISDGNGGEDSAKVNVTIKKQENSAPVAKDDNATAKEDSSVLVDVIKNDTDANGDKLTIKDITTPKHGSATQENGKIKYTPNSNYNGKDSFTYTITDGNGASDSATVNITVESVNDAPTAKDDSSETKENESVTIDVLNNDSDIDGDSLTIKSVSTPSNGTTKIVDGKIKYTPNKGYNGEDSFTYIVTDSNGAEAKAKVKITIKAINDAPVAKEDSINSSEDEAILIDVLKNDTDADGDSLTIKSVTSPSHGKAVIENGKIKYTPKENYNGKDSFSYTISDGNGAEDTTTVTVSIKAINDAPTAKDDSDDTKENESVTIDVLSNDSDIDGDSLSIKSVSTPSNGAAKIVDGKVVYTPNKGFSGKDSFTYIVSDGKADAKALVEVNVKEKPNKAPIAKDDEATTEYESSVTIDALANDSDEDSDKLIIKSISNPSNGAAKNVNGKIVYTPNKGFSGKDSFTYIISDGKEEAKALVEVTVKDKPNTAPIAKDDSANTKEDSAILIDVLSNDSDEDADNLTINITQKPLNGSVDVKDGVVKYTPNENYNGKDRFKYKVNDGNLDSKEAVVTIEVQAVNDAPVASDDSAKTKEDTTIVIDVLKNDTDIDKDDLTIKDYTAPSHGSVAIVDGKIEYTPNKDYSGKDSFSYKVSDGSGGYDSAEVEVEVTAQNDAPIAKDDRVSTEFESKLTINPLKNDSDADGDKLTIKSVGEATNGKTGIKDNKIIYTPNSKFSGEDSFEYTIEDAKGELSKATVTVVVNKPNNKVPTAKDDKVTTEYESKVKIEVLSNDKDVDGDTISIKKVANPNHGKAVVVGNVIEYTPENGFSGVDKFDYTIADGKGGEASAVVEVTVKDKPNTAPIAKDDKATTDYESVVTIDALANDSDKDKDKLSIDSIDKPSNGIATILDGKIEYKPNAGFSGKDSFKYYIIDTKGAKSSATIEVTVKEKPNRAPVAKDDKAVTNYESAVTIDALKNDRDLDKDKLIIKSVSNPSNGAVKIVDGKIEYTPNKGFSGKDSFSYIITDSKEEAKAEVIVMVKEKPNSAPIAKDDILSLKATTSIVIDVLANDKDEDGDKLSISSVSTPTYGSVKIEDGKIKYMPKASYSGEDSFSYEITDSKGAKAKATVKLTIKVENKAPIAQDDLAKVVEDKSLAIDVLANDKDENGDSLKIKIVKEPSNGIAKVENGKISYTPKTNFSGKDSISYIVSDGIANSKTATVSIEVEATNDTPMPKDDKIVTAINTKVLIDALANDIDVDKDTLTIKSIVTKPKNGVATIIKDKIEYTPNKDFNGSDSFTYMVTDGKVDANAQVDIVVKTKTGNDNKEPNPPVKIDPIEKIITMFKGMKDIKEKAKNEFLFDDGKGDIAIDKDKKEIKLSHTKTPLPKEFIGNIEDFKLENNKLEIRFGMKSNLKF